MDANKEIDACESDKCTNRLENFKYELADAKDNYIRAMVFGPSLVSKQCVARTMKQQSRIFALVTTLVEANVQFS